LAFNEQIRRLQQSLQCYANPDTKTWWENYVKESAPFLGIKMRVVRTVLHRWYEENVAGVLAYPDQLELSLALFDEKHVEEKLAGTLFLQEILLPSGVIDCSRDIDRFGALFAGGRIYDWNTCDWFCVKVLGPLIRENGLDCARRISRWRSAENLWQARASLVAFVKVADNSVYYPEIQMSCRVLIRRQERFAKTAVGWILRDISRYDDAFVRQVIEENIAHFSSESLRNATKYSEKDAQNHYRRMLRNAR
jgi:3-methyladenine DNA glycosylase AlkD